ncbi:MAG: hypothetical protein ACYTDY_09235 [Planctomycetota bacterium]|jgi:hypothetical protein
MRKTVSAAAVLLILAVPGLLLATERESRLRAPFRSTFPKEPEKPKEGEEPKEPPKPLLVYVICDHHTRDQDRFDEVLMKNESFLLAAKFFCRVRIWESKAKDHPLLKAIKFKAPALVAFDSTRKERAVAVGRASGTKAYELLVKIGQLDYETGIAKTVREARNLLGTFDRVDAARGAISVKVDRLEDAKGKGDQAKIRRLTKELEIERARMEALYEKAQKRWGEIWTLKRKKR